jgi:hypothetical protein
MDAYLVNFSIMTRVVANNAEEAIKIASDKLANSDTSEYFISDNVEEVKKDTGVPLIQATFVKHGNQFEPVLPSSLGLKNITLKSFGYHEYQPRFTLANRHYNDEDRIVIQFGHYWGGGAYYLDTIKAYEHDTGLNLYGGDTSGNSTIPANEMNKLLDWIKENGYALLTGLLDSRLKN